MYLKAIELGSKIALKNIAITFYNNNELDPDYEESANYYYRHYKETDDETSKQKFSNIVKTKKISWKIDYHPFWISKRGLDDRIVTVLLISRFRDFSVLNETKIVMVKGVSLNIIKFLCHFSQKIVK